MRRQIIMKHVQPKKHLRGLVDELLDRLEQQAEAFDRGSVSTHVTLEQNEAHSLFSVNLSCTVPKKTLAVREEGHEAGDIIREAFSELERQLKKYKAKARHEYDRRAAAKQKGAID